MAALTQRCTASPSLVPSGGRPAHAHQQAHIMPAVEKTLLFERRDFLYEFVCRWPEKDRDVSDL